MNECSRDKLMKQTMCFAIWYWDLWPNDVMWRQRSGSTLAQVIACCLMAASHYLNQCWLITNQGVWHLFEGNIQKINLKKYNIWNIMGMLKTTIPPYNLLHIPPTMLKMDEYSQRYYWVTNNRSQCAWPRSKPGESGRCPVPTKRTRRF